MKTKIHTLIVTYNRKALLYKVIKAVMSQGDAVSIITIVDNNSHDGTEEYLFDNGIINKDFKEYEDVGKISLNKINELKVFYIKLAKNLGGSGGFYYGVKFALSISSEWEWLLFLDDDAMPEKDCLKTLLKFKNKSDVLIPLRVSNPINYLEFPAIRFNMKNPFLREVRDISFYKKFKDIEELPDTVEVEDFSFEGPLIKKEIVQEIGLPKKDIFISGDDTDYALRILRKYGKKHLLITKARIERLNPSKPQTEIPLWKEYYLKRNYYYTHFKYGENIFVKAKPFFLFVFSIIKNVLKMKMSFEMLKVQFYAFIDSFKKEMPLRYKP